jgi:hypothetical protein
VAEGTLRMATSRQARREESRSGGASRQLFVFLIAADVIVLLIYLLVLPSGEWERVDSRVRAIASLVASGLAYFGLDRLLKKRVGDYDAVLGSPWFQALLVLVTPVLWLGTLPVWSPRFVFSPPQANPPDIVFAGKSRQWVNTDKRTSAGDPIFQVDGLLLRSYEYTVATGRQTSYYLPLISILKGIFFHGPVIIQLPCSVQLPYISNAKVKYRKFQGDKIEDYGSLPGNGKIYLMPGHYDYIGIETNDEEGSSSLDLKCPSSESLAIDMKAK